MADENSKYIALEGIEHGNRFYTSNDPNKDQTKSFKGELWYRVLGYADSSEEARRILYPTKADEEFALLKHNLEMVMKMSGVEVEECTLK